MCDVKRLCLTMIAATSLALFGFGCESTDKTDAEQKSEHPTGEHPEGDHPSGDHPSGDHPDHPSGDHPDHPG